MECNQKSQCSLKRRWAMLTKTYYCRHMYKKRRRFQRLNEERNPVTDTGNGKVKRCSRRWFQNGKAERLNQQRYEQNGNLRILNDSSKKQAVITQFNAVCVSHPPHLNHASNPFTLDGVEKLRRRSRRQGIGGQPQGWRNGAREEE